MGSPGEEQGQGVAWAGGSLSLCLSFHICKWMSELNLPHGRVLNQCY